MRWDGASFRYPAYMRVLLLFDLPTETAAERREYTRFRKYLIKNGFFMMQESVYCKLALNQTVVNGLLESVRKNKPQAGLVQVLVITENRLGKKHHMEDTLVIDEDLCIF